MHQDIDTYDSRGRKMTPEDERKVLLRYIDRVRETNVARWHKGRDPVKMHPHTISECARLDISLEGIAAPPIKRKPSPARKMKSKPSPSPVVNPEDVPAFSHSDVSRILAMIQELYAVDTSNILRAYHIARQGA